MKKVTLLSFILLAGMLYPAVAQETILQVVGTAQNGGAYNQGTIFRVDADGTNPVVLRDLESYSGMYPTCGLTPLPDGSLRGIAPGGYSGAGVIFWVTPGGSFTRHHYFDYDAFDSKGSLFFGSNGLLYGTTTRKGNAHEGTIFSIKPNGQDFTTVHSFTDSEGQEPYNLIQSSDGTLYGETLENGLFGSGSLYKMNSDGSGFAVIHHFNEGVTGPPYSGQPIFGNDGWIYGVRGRGGPFDRGFIYKMKTDGSDYSLIHIFNAAAGGGLPTGIVAAPNGLLYGATFSGSATSDSGFGVLFSINTDGSDYTILHNFNGDRPGGWKPVFRDNMIYGTSVIGGPDNAGGVYRFDLTTGTLHTIVQLNNTLGKNSHGPLTLVEVLPLQAPTQSTTDLSLLGVSNTGMYAAITPGNGEKRLIVMKAGSASTFIPQDNVAYGVGDLGSGDRIIYNSAGYGNTATDYVNLRDLQPDTEYFFTSYEYNDDGIIVRYRVDSALVASQRTLKSIVDFSLVYFKTNTTISNFDDLVVLDVADPQMLQYSIRANASWWNVGRVEYSLDGTLLARNTMNPYTLVHWVLPVLSRGLHVVTARAYAWDDRPLETVTFLIHVINSVAVTQFDVIDQNGNTVQTLADGDVLNLSDPALDDFNVVARTSSATSRSVKFELNGITARLDNRAPFAVGGYPDGSEKPWGIGTGSFTLTATPYVRYHAWGPFGAALTVNFSIINVPLTNASARGVMDDFAIYPIPVKEFLNVELGNAFSEKSSIEILNSTGERVFVGQPSFAQRTFTIPVQEFATHKGMYLVRAHDNTGRSGIIRFIVE